MRFTHKCNNKIQNQNYCEEIQNQLTTREIGGSLGLGAWSAVSGELNSAGDQRHGRRLDGSDGGQGPYWGRRKTRV